VDLPALALIGPAGWAPAALERWRDSDDPLFHPRAPLDGAALQENLGLTPGPQLGRLLNHLSRERAFGRLPRQASGPDPQILTAARLWLSRNEATRHG